MVNIPSEITEKIWNGVVDFLVDYGKSRLSDEMTERIKGLRSDSVTSGEVQKAIESAAKRFETEYPDKQLSLALTHDTRFYDLPSVNKAVKELLAHPFDPAPKLQLEESFASVLPISEASNANDAAHFFLERLREALIGIKKLHDMLDLMLLLDGNRTRSDMAETLKRIENLLATMQEKPKATSLMPSNTTSATSDFSATENPFFSGGAVPSDLFVGRTSTLALIRSRLGGKSLQSVSIVGERRMGKSSILRYVAERAGALFSNQPVVVMLDLMRGYCQTRSGFMKALRREIHRACGREPWSTIEDDDIAALSFGIEDLYASGVRLILCLDEMEELTCRREQFDDVLESLRAAGQMGQVGLLTASAHPLGELCQSNNLLSPFFNIFMQDTLGLLSKDEWVNLITTKMQVSTDELNAIQEIANGQPFYTQIAAGRLWEAKNGNLDPNWIGTAQNDIEPHWQSQWQHFTELEKSTLRFSAGVQQGSVNSRAVENLTRRGLLADGKPFSAAYQKWLKDISHA